MEQKKIYVVNGSQDSGAPRAIFDSKDMALAFVSRFKKNREHVIYEGVLNPSFVVDKERTPYEVSFSADGDVCIREQGLYEYEIKTAEWGGHIIGVPGLICFVVAKDEIDALSQATATKNRLIADGKWERPDEPYVVDHFEIIPIEHGEGV